MKLGLKRIELTKGRPNSMYPKLENTNQEATLRIEAIASSDPYFLLGQVLRLAESVKHNIPAMAPSEIERLIADFRHVSLPPLAAIPLDELAAKLARYISDVELSDHIASFDPIEAFFLMTALEFYFADERNNPDRPVTIEAYLPFMPVEGIDQL